MASEERCDLAIWDVGGELLEIVRTQLKQRVQRNGPKLTIETGEWRGRRLAIGRPKPVIARHAPTLAEAIPAIVTAHRPALLVVVGPAAAAGKAFPLGQVVAADVAMEVQELPNATIRQGPQERRGADSQITTDWVRDATEVVNELGIDATLLAVVTETPSGEGKTLRPPVSRPPTPSRRAGAFVGKLLVGKIDLGESKREPQQAAAQAIELLIHLRRADRS